MKDKSLDQGRFVRDGTGLRLMPAVIAAMLIIVFVVIPVDQPGSGLGAVEAAAAEGRALDDVSAFVIEKLELHGAFDTRGLFLDYGDASPLGNSSWLLHFDIYKCFATTILETCAAVSPGGLVVEVDALSDQTMEITRADGEIPESLREALVGQRQLSATSRSGWATSKAQLVSLGQSELIEGAPFWTGPIPALGEGSKCRGQLLDSAGLVLWDSREMELAAPDREDKRSGQILSFGGVPEGLQGDPRIACEMWKGSGWTLDPDTPPTFEVLPTSQVAVVARLVWSDPSSFEAVYTKCVSTAMDSSGAALGSTAAFLDGPDAAQGRTSLIFDQPFLVDVSPQEDVAKVEVVCQLTTPETFARA